MKVCCKPASELETSGRALLRTTAGVNRIQAAPVNRPVLRVSRQDVGFASRQTRCVKK